MKIQEALEIARDCKLGTVGEALENIRIHALSLFSPFEISKELTELRDTWEWVKEHRRFADGSRGINEDTSVEYMLEHGIAEDLVDYEIYQEAVKYGKIPKG